MSDIDKTLEKIQSVLECRYIERANVQRVIDEFEKLKDDLEKKKNSDHNPPREWWIVMDPHYGYVMFEDRTKAALHAEKHYNREIHVREVMA